jgi:uncharacterized membrane protein
MSPAYELIKWVHIVSSTVLFGFGAGSAYYMWMAHLSGDVRTIARVFRLVARTDVVVTGTTGLVQPATGFWLVSYLGYSLTASWLVAVYALYALAFACWAPVVWLQMRAARLAETALREDCRLGADYRRVMRAWFALGWPAFCALLAIFWLMIAKPQLW